MQDIVFNGEILESIGYGDRVDSDVDFSQSLGFHSFDQRYHPDSPYTMDELDNYRFRGRRLASRNPVGIGVLDILSTYVIGDGYDYSVVPVSDEEGSRWLIGRAERILKEWRVRNHWSEQSERDCLKTIVEDGEKFYAIRVPDLSLIDVASERVRDPVGLGTGWRYGIRYDSAERPTSYAVEVGESSFSQVPASQMVHLRSNRYKRSESEFVPVMDHLDDAEILLRNMRLGASVQASIAFIREQGQQTTSGMLGGIRKQNATSRKTHRGPDGQQTTRYTRRYDPGAIIDVGSQIYKPGPLGAPHGTNFLSIVNACYRIAGTRWQIPEYMISGSAEHYRYATALVAGTPFVRSAERHQRRFGRLFSHLFMRVLQAANEVDGWAGMPWGEVIRRITVNAVGSPVAVGHAPMADGESSL